MHHPLLINGTRTGCVIGAYPMDAWGGGGLTLGIQWAMPPPYSTCCEVLCLPPVNGHKLQNKS